MGKKNKTFKLKQYKAPPEKFLVVVNPWGIYGNFDAADLNHIGAWFQVMLRDEYPTARVGAVYYQRTHRNIIVELPKEVDDTEQYLGAHYYSKFFLGVASTNEVAHIYEYKYVSFGDPTDKNFSIGHPMYDAIPDNFPIKYPYPLSSPAPQPPVDVPYARTIPLEVNERLAARHHSDPEPSVSNTEAGSSLSSAVDNLNLRSCPPALQQQKDPSSATLASKEKGKERERSPLPPSPAVDGFTPYVRPGHLSSSLMKRADTLSTQIKREDTSEYAGRSETVSQMNDEAQDFLASIFTSEESRHILKTETNEYKPSAALLEALGTLSVDLVNAVEGTGEAASNIKTEPLEVSPSFAVYKPSGDLLSALATLPGNLTYPEETIKSVHPNNHTRIKQEPLDPIDFGVETPPIAFAPSGRHPSSFNNSSPSHHKSDLFSKDGKLRQDSSLKKRYIKDVGESRHNPALKRVKVEQH